jgi:signal transduction histidine kinase
LNVSKIEQGGMRYEFMPTDLSKIAGDIAAEMKIPAESKSLELIQKIPKYDNFMVSADPVKIRQVFLNLVDNSIKYTASGFIEIGLTREENSVVFYVKDSGIGIAPETKTKLFQKFSRGEGARVNTGGSGLGLYLAAEIVKAHKGEIKIDSEGLGKGTTFSVILPNGFKDQAFNRPS